MKYVRHKGTPEERFWQKVDKNGPMHPTLGTPCWLWVAGSVNNKGYASFHVRPGVRPLSHRFSWQIANGIDPGEMDVLHRCDRPLCVNPGHLFLGTHIDNMRDMVAKGRFVGNRYRQRTHCKSGHEFTPENTYWWNAHRQCRACKAAFYQQHGHRKTA